MASPADVEEPASGEGAPKPSLAQIYREHFAFVWRALRRLGVAEADVPDAVQDVFIVVQRRLGRFDYSAKITTWLYAICMRVASDRRRSAHARHEVIADIDLAGSQGSDAESDSEPSWRRRVLERALDAMPLEQRAVFTLFELDGWAGDRIADLLQVPLATVHSRLRLARAVFRSVVARHRKQEEFLQKRMGLRHA